MITIGAKANQTQGHPLVYVINKELSSFIFVGELATVRNCQFSKERRRKWLRLTGGKLNKLESHQLQLFKDVFQRQVYPAVEAHFLTYEGDRVWSKLGSFTGPAEVEIIANTLKLFEKRFNLLWQKEKLKLTAVRSHLLKNKNRHSAAMAQIQKLCATNLPKAGLNLNLTISSSHLDYQGWYSKLGKETSLVLECSGFQARDLPFLEMIAVHEAFHFLLRKNTSLWALLDEVATLNKKSLGPLTPDLPVRYILEELLISCFVPEGVFGPTFFGLNTTKRRGNSLDVKSFTSVRRYCAQRMRAEALLYVRNNKNLDRSFLEKIGITR
jgi:hypothetical protein